jgi:hemerythrin-like domain-containing protein
LEESEVAKATVEKPGALGNGKHSSGPAGPNGTGDIEAVTGVHAQILRACDRLESICDSLPHAYNRVDVLEMSEWLEQSFPQLIQQEEGSLTRITPATEGDWEDAARIWKRHHRTDVSYAGELAEALEEFAQRDEASAVDTLAYMMRGFFEAVRRHVAYEEVLVAYVTDGAAPRHQGA